jgi:hypothetical protein
MQISTITICSSRFAIFLVSILPSDPSAGQSGRLSPEKAKTLQKTPNCGRKKNRGTNVPRRFSAVVRSGIGKTADPSHISSRSPD